MRTLKQEVWRVLRRCFPSPVLLLPLLLLPYAKMAAMTHRFRYWAGLTADATVVAFSPPVWLVSRTSFLCMLFPFGFLSFLLCVSLVCFSYLPC